MKQNSVIVILIIIVILLGILFTKVNKPTIDISDTNDTIRYYENQIQQSQKVLDSLVKQIFNKDSLLALHRTEIIYIQQHYDSQITYINGFSINQSIEFFTNWLSQNDTIRNR